MLYVATGVRFIREAMFAAASVRRISPHLKIGLVTDRPTYPGLSALFDWICELHDPSHGFSDKIRGLRLCPWPDFVFLDTDTYLVDQLEDASWADVNTVFGAVVSEVRETPAKYAAGFSLNFGPSFPEYNTGVLLCGGDGLQEALDRWLSIHTDLSRQLGINIPDQISFRAMIRDLRLPVRSLPCEYNLRTPFPAYIEDKVKIIHGRLGPRHCGRYDRFARKLNSRTGPRVYVPGLGVFGGYGSRLWDWVRIVERVRRVREEFSDRQSSRRAPADAN